MKRLFFALLIMLFAVVPCSAVDGSVSLANIRLSLVNGTAFVDFSAAGTLTPYLNSKLTLTDSAGKKAMGYIKAAGTGETLGEEMVSGWTNSVAYPFETFTAGAGNTITQAINGSGGYGQAECSVTATAGALYKVVQTINVASGITPALVWYTGVGSPFLVISTTGTTTGKYVAASAAYTRLVEGTSTQEATDFSIPVFSLKQVIAPSATGVTITSTAGGTTYNWTSIESGFDYNDAKGYTYKLTAPATGGFGFGFGFGF